MTVMRYIFTVPSERSFAVKRTRFILALGFFCVIFGLVAFPQLFVVGIACRVLGFPAWLRRRAIARRIVFWGDLVFRVACRLMRITPRFRLPEAIPSRAIVIANHQSTFDVAVMVAILKRADLPNTRWVVKAQIARAPVIGWMARETGCAFVNRTKDPNDLDNISRVARQARDDDASVLLFPEGTRFTRPVRDSDFEQLLPPKLGGFGRLTQSLPDYPVLSVTLRWNPPRRTAEGKTIFQIADLVGRELFIDARLVPAETVAADGNWLVNEWKRKDADLAAGPS